MVDSTGTAARCSGSLGARSPQNGRLCVTAYDSTTRSIAFCQAIRSSSLSTFTLVVHCSLLIAHCSLLIAHCSLLIAHCSLLIAHCSLIHRIKMPKSLTFVALLAVTAALACAPHDPDDAASGATTSVVTSAGPSAVATNSALPTVTVYKSPTCGCCKAWVDHMKQAGFQVVAIDTS